MPSLWPDALLLEPAELDAPDLAAARLRQRFDELDLAGVLVRCGHTLAVLLEVEDEAVTGFVARPEDDERLHDLPAVGVRLADDRALGDRLVLEQRALDLERPDPVGGREDDVVRAAGEPQVAVLVSR